MTASSASAEEMRTKAEGANGWVAASSAAAVVNLAAALVALVALTVWGGDGSGNGSGGGENAATPAHKSTASSLEAHRAHEQKAANGAAEGPEEAA